MNTWALHQIIRGKVMPELKEVARDIFTFQSPVPGINRVLTSWVIKNQPAVLIDPGPAASIPYIRAALEQLDINRLAYIIPTHIHLDHAGSLGHLAVMFPDAKIVLHPAAARHMTEPGRLIESTRMTFGPDFADVWGTILPVPEPHIKVAGDGEIIETGGRPLKVVYTPGHAPHHISLYDAVSGGVFSGEALGVPLTGADAFPFPAAVPPNFDPDVYVASIEKIRALKPRLVFYSHDGVSDRTDAMMDAVYRTTIKLGELVREAILTGDNAEQVAAKIQHFVTAQTGNGSAVSDRTMAAIAYLMYFRKKGLVK
jgi:glyoxylase-like metal-dependent hydrolase (beta-lactamase superfamily II)